MQARISWWRRRLLQTSLRTPEYRQGTDSSSCILALSRQRSIERVDLYYLTYEREQRKQTTTNILYCCTAVVRYRYASSKRDLRPNNNQLHTNLDIKLGHRHRQIRYVVLDRCCRMARVVHVWVLVCGCCVVRAKWAQTWRKHQNRCGFQRVIFAGQSARDAGSFKVFLLRRDV